MIGAPNASRTGPPASSRWLAEPREMPMTCLRGIASLIAVLAGMAMAGPGAGQEFAPAIVFDMGGKFDKSFNEAAYNGAERFKKETGIAYREFEVTAEA